MTKSASWEASEMEPAFIVTTAKGQQYECKVDETDTRPHFFMKPPTTADDMGFMWKTSVKGDWKEWKTSYGEWLILATPEGVLRAKEWKAFGWREIRPEITGMKVRWKWGEKGPTPANFGLTESEVSRNSLVHRLLGSHSRWKAYQEALKVHQKALRAIAYVKAAFAKEHLRQSCEFWITLKGTELEKEVGKLFVSLGYSVNHCGGANDEGIDLLLDYRRVLVQCKGLQSPLQPVVLREVLGTLNHHIIGGAIVVCPAGFTEAATKFAVANGMVLLSASDLVALKNDPKNAPAYAKLRSENLLPESRPGKK